jgi:hypothetical protein
MIPKVGDIVKVKDTYPDDGGFGLNLPPETTIGLIGAIEFLSYPIGHYIKVKFSSDKYGYFSPKELSLKRGKSMKELKIGDRVRVKPHRSSLIMCGCTGTISKIVRDYYFIDFDVLPVGKEEEVSNWFYYAGELQVPK